MREGEESEKKKEREAKNERRARKRRRAASKDKMGRTEEVKVEVEVEDSAAQQESPSRKETALCILCKALYPLNPRNNPCPVSEGAQKKEEKRGMVQRKKKTKEKGT